MANIRIENVTEVAPEKIQKTTVNGFVKEDNEKEGETESHTHRQMDRETDRGRENWEQTQFKISEVFKVILGQLSYDCFIINGPSLEPSKRGTNTIIFQSKI